MTWFLDFAEIIIVNGSANIVVDLVALLLILEHNLKQNTSSSKVRMAHGKKGWPITCMCFVFV